MDAKILDGKALAASIREELREKTELLKKERGVTPSLAVIVAGDDPASAVYVRNKERACVNAGMNSIVRRLPGDVTQEELESVVAGFNADDSVHGILVQLPLPRHLDEKRVLALIDLARDATVTICHSKPQDLAALTKNADILVAAVGRPRMITGDMIKPGATVIDVGINRTDDGLVGDVDFASALPVAGAITPVPGGVGPMTIAMLLENTYIGACASCAKA